MSKLGFWHFEYKKIIMNKLLLVVSVVVFTTMTVNAQKQVGVTAQPTTEENSKVLLKKRTPQFSTSTSAKSDSQNKKQSLLQELYSIEDERHRIEKNESLSQSERGSEIQKNNASYQSKKTEFKNYVSAKGILNVTKQEQNFYLSILKYEDKEGYSKNIELIKSSK